MQKIATKLTARVAEFVNKHNIGRVKYSSSNGYFHYPDYFNKNHRRTPILQGYTEVTEQDFIDTLTRELNLNMVVKEDMICPTTKKHFNDECCPVGSICNLSSSDMFTDYDPPTEVFNPQEHYNNEYGSLYKIADQRGWNAYMFDIIKRIDRCEKKGQFKEDLQKTKDLIDLWLKEMEETK